MTVFFTKRKKEPDKEKVKILVNACVEQLLKELPKNVKQNGRSVICRVSFKIPRTQNRGVLAVEDMGEKACLRVLVHRTNNDRAYSNYLFSCPHGETEQYLREKVDTEEICSSVIHLSEKVDDYWSEA